MKPLEVLGTILTPLLVLHTFLVLVGYPVDHWSVVVGALASWATFVWLGYLELRKQREKSRS